MINTNITFRKCLNDYYHHYFYVNNNNLYHHSWLLLLRRRRRQQYQQQYQICSSSSSICPNRTITTSTCTTIINTINTNHVTKWNRNIRLLQSIQYHQHNHQNHHHQYKHLWKSFSTTNTTTITSASNNTGTTNQSTLHNEYKQSLINEIESLKDMTTITSSDSNTTSNNDNDDNNNNNSTTTKTTTTSYYNIPQHIIQSCIGRNLYQQQYHPLCIVQQHIVHYFNVILPNTINNNSKSDKHQQQQEGQQVEGNTIHPTPTSDTTTTTTTTTTTATTTTTTTTNTTTPYFTIYDNISPIVSTDICFDQLLIPFNHPSRELSDTYYINETTVLRPHTSAHQIQCIQKEYNKSNYTDNVEQLENDTSPTSTTTTTKKYVNPLPKPIQFLIIGDVYRRDEIDKTHYPVFHQIEGVKLFNTNNNTTNTNDIPKSYRNNPIEYIQQDLKKTLEGLITYLFEQSALPNKRPQMRWRNDAFPFTDPSYELDINFASSSSSSNSNDATTNNNTNTTSAKTNTTSTEKSNSGSDKDDDDDDWMEILGCGIIRYEILENTNCIDTKNVDGWAFGIGLERLAMILYQIPDIRLFWSSDVRFLNQFVPNDNKNDDNTNNNKNQSLLNRTFQPYSKYPPCIKDISYWIPEYEKYHVNEFYELVRTIAGSELIEKVELIDSYCRINKKDLEKSKVSHCYRITYRSMDRSLTNHEIDTIQEQIRKQVVQQLNVQLR